MSQRPIAQQLLQRQLPILAQSRAQACRVQAVGRRWYASGDKEDRDSFKGQLYQSTHERVQREKEEQSRFAQHRDTERASGSSFGLVIPLGRIEVIRDLNTEANIRSTRRWRSRRMVLRQTATQSCLTTLYSTARIDNPTET